MFLSPTHWLGRFLDIIGWDPSVCKSNRLLIRILRFSFIKLGVYSINSSKMIGKFPAMLNFTSYSSNSTGAFVTNCRFSPIIGPTGLMLWYFCCSPWYLGIFLRFLLNDQIFSWTSTGWFSNPTSSSVNIAQLSPFIGLSITFILATTVTVMSFREKSWSSTIHSSIYEYLIAKRKCMGTRWP